MFREYKLKISCAKWWHFAQIIATLWLAIWTGSCVPLRNVDIFSSCLILLGNDFIGYATIFIRNKCVILNYKPVDSAHQLLLFESIPFRIPWSVSGSMMTVNKICLAFEAICVHNTTCYIWLYVGNWTFNVWYVQAGTPILMLIFEHFKYIRVLVLHNPLLLIK